MLVLCFRSFCLAYICKKELNRVELMELLNWGNPPTNICVQHWYVAKTRYFRQELKIRDWLTEHSIENFVPTERLRTQGRTAKTSERVLAPNLVFLKASKEDACSYVSDYGLQMQYIIDCATHRMMVIPDKEMDDFVRVFNYSVTEGGLVDRKLDLGDRVRVTQGPLSGVEGNVVELDGRYYVVVGLHGFMWAKAHVPRAWLEKVR